MPNRKGIFRQPRQDYTSQCLLTNEYLKQRRLNNIQDADGILISQTSPTCSLEGINKQRCLILNIDEPDSAPVLQGELKYECPLDNPSSSTKYQEGKKIKQGFVRHETIVPTKNSDVFKNEQKNRCVGKKFKTNKNTLRSEKYNTLSNRFKKLALNKKPNVGEVIIVKLLNENDEETCSEFTSLLRKQTLQRYFGTQSKEFCIKTNDKKLLYNLSIPIRHVKSRRTKIDEKQTNNKNDDNNDNGVPKALRMKNNLTANDINNEVSKEIHTSSSTSTYFTSSEGLVINHVTSEQKKQPTNKYFGTRNTTPTQSDGNKNENLQKNNKKKMHFLNYKKYSFSDLNYLPIPTKCCCKRDDNSVINGAATKETPKMNEAIKYVQAQTHAFPGKSKLLDNQDKSHFHLMHCHKQRKEQDNEKRKTIEPCSVLSVITSKQTQTPVLNNTHFNTGAVLNYLEMRIQNPKRREVAVSDIGTDMTDESKTDIALLQEKQTRNIDYTNAFTVEFSSSRSTARISIEEKQESNADEIKRTKDPATTDTQNNTTCIMEGTVLNDTKIQNNKIVDADKKSTTIKQSMVIKPKCGANDSQPSRKIIRKRNRSRETDKSHISGSSTDTELDNTTWLEKYRNLQEQHHSKSVKLQRRSKLLMIDKKKHPSPVKAKQDIKQVLEDVVKDMNENSKFLRKQYKVDEIQHTFYSNIVTNKKFRYENNHQELLSKKKRPKIVYKNKNITKNLSTIRTENSDKSKHHPLWQIITKSTQTLFNNNQHENENAVEVYRIPKKSFSAMFIKLDKTELTDYIILKKDWTPDTETECAFFKEVLSISTPIPKGNYTRSEIEIRRLLDKTKNTNLNEPTNPKSCELTSTTKTRHVSRASQTCIGCKSCSRNHASDIEVHMSVSQRKYVKTLNKSTQMTEYMTESQLYCVQWINRYLLPVYLNYNCIVIDKYIKDISEEFSLDTKDVQEDNTADTYYESTFS